MKKIFVLIVIVALFGCKHHHDTINQDTSMNLNRSDSGTGLTEDTDGPNKVISDNRGPDGASISENLTSLQPVFFDYDSSEIKPDQIPALQSDGRSMRANAAS